MVMRFTCTHCGKRLKTEESAAGRSTTCPKCGTKLVVPTPEDAARPATEHPSLLLRKKHRGFEDLIDMTAMVDIVFFMLIFFMITSMQPVESVIKLPTPQAQASSAVSVADFTNDPNYVTVTIYEDDTVWLEEQEVFGGQDLRSRLRAARKADPLLTGMLVVGSPDATHGTFVMVLDAGADAGLGELMFSVQDRLDATAGG